MRRPPTIYVAALVILVIVGVYALLTYLGVPPFDNLSTFLVLSASSIVLLLVATTVGGAFFGMLLAQRMLWNREFSPFERNVMESLQDIRDRLEKLESSEKMLKR